jgi:hypothetical protein
MQIVFRSINQTSVVLRIYFFELIRKVPQNSLTRIKLLNSDFNGYYRISNHVNIVK